ncbi:MAG: HEAT repeat domain-containing protein, partial [Ktedonobacteraceae bacterium]
IALPRLLRELETRPLAGGPQPLHGIILPMIARFLDEPDPTRQLTPVQNEQVMDALMSLLATHTNTVDLEQVRAILVSQGRLAEERESGKIALSMLVQNLTAANESVARSMSGTLKEVGQVATPRLLEQLANQPAEAERVRILEVLASLHDPRALPALLDLLPDDSLAVQQALAAALKLYVPTCIAGLLDALLHHTDDLVAARAEQILGELGSAVVEPLMQALTPLVAGRTPLLVHVLERARDSRAVPVLIELLESTQTDVILTLALAQALGQLGDERAVTPLLNLLSGTNALLAEGALNALSSLGEPACPLLLTRLATSQKTPLVTRIERVLLGMQPFPGMRLLQTVDEGNADQARHLAEVFLQRGSDAAQVLVENLFHEQRRIREYTRQVMERVDGRYAVPALLEALSRPDPAWRALLAEYLLKHPREAIPALVGLLDDPARYEAVVAILLQAGAPVLPELLPAMEASDNGVQACARHILVALVQQQPDVLANVVQLFGLALPPRAHALLQHVLTDDLAESSLPALLVGLEDAH